MSDYLQHWQYEAFKAHWLSQLRYQDLLLKPAEKKP
jgi:hypothetical protein